MDRLPNHLISLLMKKLTGFFHQNVSPKNKLKNEIIQKSPEKIASFSLESTTKKPNGKTEEIENQLQYSNISGGKRSFSRGGKKP